MKYGVSSEGSNEVEDDWARLNRACSSKGLAEVYDSSIESKIWATLSCKSKSWESSLFSLT